MKRAVAMNPKSTVRYRLPLREISIFLAGLFACCVSLYALARFGPDVRAPRGFLPYESGIQEDISGHVPNFPKKQVVFWNDSAYSPTPHSTPDERRSIMNNWSSLVPRGQGFISVSRHPKDGSSSSYTKDDSIIPERSLKDVLPPPLSAYIEDGKYIPERYGIAVYHQIHCLQSIMSAYLGLYFSDSGSRDHTHHVFHCFDYLRQVLQCTADTSLEGSDPGTYAGSTRGFGTTHICKDYSALAKWAERVRVLDDEGT